MCEVKIKRKPDREEEITQADYEQFLKAKTYEDRLQMLLLHAQKNQKIIQAKRGYQMENKAKTQQEIEQEMLALNDQFREFLHTKGIAAKFKLAFSDMSESAHRQHEADSENFKAVKAQSAEDNKEFAEFLHTKGVKAKFHLAVENIKKGANAAPHNTAAQIAKVRAQTQDAVARAASYGKASATPPILTAESLADEFNAFLKAKGLDSQYSVVITEEES